jgi:hypothetical protein
MNGPESIDARPPPLRTALRSLAIAIAAVAALGETVRSWGVDRPIYAVVDDYLVAALLVAAALRATRKDGPALLAGAFGFATGIFYSSFFGHMQALARAEADPGRIPQGCLTAAIGALFAGMVIGFVLSLRESIRAARA